MATKQEVGEGMLSPKIKNFLKGYSLNLTRNSYDAEDLRQETIVKALSAAHQYESGTNLGSWLATIMRNIHLGGIQRAKKSPIMPAGVIDLMETWDLDVAVERDMDAAMTLEQVAEILSGLGKNTYGMLLAKVVDGRKEKDIARDFGVPVGTVKSRINRARAAVKNALQA